MTTKRNARTDEYCALHDEDKKSDNRREGTGHDCRHLRVYTNAKYVEDRINENGTCDT